MLRLLVSILFVTLALAQTTTYSVKGQYISGCSGTCKCASNTSKVTGSFTLANLSAGLLLQNIQLNIAGASRSLTGVAVLHQNSTIQPTPLQYGDFIINDTGNTLLLSFREEYTTDLPEIVVGYASDWSSCYSHSLSFSAQPTDKK